MKKVAAYSPEITVVCQSLSADIYFYQNEPGSVHYAAGYEMCGRDRQQSATLQRDTTKIFNNFIIMQCNVTKITPYINGLLVVLMQHFLIIHFIHWSVVGYIKGDIDNIFM